MVLVSLDWTNTLFPAATVLASIVACSTLPISLTETVAVTPTSPAEIASDPLVTAAVSMLASETVPAMACKVELSASVVTWSAILLVATAPLPEKPADTASEAAPVSIVPPSVAEMAMPPAASTVAPSITSAEMSFSRSFSDTAAPTEMVDEMPPAAASDLISPPPVDRTATLPVRLSTRAPSIEASAALRSLLTAPAAPPAAEPPTAMPPASDWMVASFAAVTSIAPDCTPVANTLVVLPAMLLDT